MESNTCAIYFLKQSILFKKEKTMRVLTLFRRLMTLKLLLLGKKKIASMMKNFIILISSVEKEVQYCNKFTWFLVVLYKTSFIWLITSLYAYTQQID